MRDEDPNELYQIFVDAKRRDNVYRTLAIGPRMGKTFLEPLVEKINRFVIEGKEKTWRNARLEKVVSLSHGSPFTREDRQNDRVGGYREETVAESSFSIG